MSDEQLRELAGKYEEAVSHLVNMVNTSTVDLEDVHSMDQIKALQGAEEWLKKHL